MFPLILQERIYSGSVFQYPGEKHPYLSKYTFKSFIGKRSGDKSQLPDPEHCVFSKLGVDRVVSKTVREDWRINQESSIPDPE